MSNHISMHRYLKLPAAPLKLQSRQHEEWSIALHPMQGMLKYVRPQNMQVFLALLCPAHKLLIFVLAAMC